MAKVTIEKTEEIRAECKYFVLRVGLLVFKVARNRLEGIKQKLLKLQKKRSPKTTIEQHSKALIINAIKFDKRAAGNLSLYNQQPPILCDVVETMVEQLYAEVKFKDDSDGQQKLTEPKPTITSVAKTCSDLAKVLPAAKRSHHKKVSA